MEADGVLARLRERLLKTVRSRGPAENRLKAENAALRTKVKALRRSLEGYASMPAAIAKAGATALISDETLTRLAASGAHGDSSAKVLERVRAIIDAQLDGLEDTAAIKAYHATLDKKAYDAVWRERLGLISRVILSGELHLARAVATVCRLEERRRGMTLEPASFVVFDTPVRLPSRTGNRVHRASIIDAVLDHVTPETSKIIETGSGWGEHLLNIFNEGGPREAGYYACEIEQEGRKCALLLAALDSALRLQAPMFDYLAPNYSAIPKDDGHTIIFSVHSIEQVAEIPREVIVDALALSPAVTGFHFEPIGWQLIPESEWNDETRAHAERCRMLRYNRNLWSLLKTLQSDGQIRIVKAVPNFFGLQHNPATLIQWEKVRTSA